MNKTRKRLISLPICILLVIVMAIPASARASAYFDYTNLAITNISNGSIKIKLHVLATGTMQEVGATEVVIYEKKSDGGFDPVYTFTKENYPSMVTYNRMSYITYLTYYGSTGKSYYVLAAFYAKNSSGSQTKWVSTSVINT